MGTDVAVRRTLDLTRAPDEQWNEEMTKLIASQVFRGREVTKGELYYCLAVAEGVGLNPLIGEIYFIPAKSKNGMGPTLTPYVGRNGLVAKATEHGTYYESDTVRANDRFRMARTKAGEVQVTHSYGSGERGAIVGAWAFLHDNDGRRKPAFFYAKLEEYLPEFDADWKMAASPWGNQRSAMIEKCAMIGAGRKRLNLGNVLADGELAIVEQMQGTGPSDVLSPAQATEFDFSTLTEDQGLAERLSAAVARMDELSPMSWTPAKIEMVTAGKSDPELAEIAAKIEREAETLARHAEEAAAARPRSSAGDSSAAAAPSGEAITDAQVVDEAAEERARHAASLRGLIQSLEDQLNEPGVDEDSAQRMTAELGDLERELAAVENPGQGSLL